MELLFIPLFFFYIAALKPELFVSVFPFAFILSIPLILSLKWQKLDLFALSALLLLLLFCNGYDIRELKLSFSPDLCDGYYCKIVSQPAGRDKRKKGFTVSLIAQRDLLGNVYSASGVLYAVGEDMDMNIFDTVYLSGYIKDGLIRYSSSDVISESKFSQIRKKLITNVRKRLHSSRSGLLMQLLILGSSDLGNGDISEKASQSGLRHVIALSGMHLAALSILLFPFKVFGRRIYRFFEVFSMVLFTFLSGWRASLLRALLFRLFSKWGLKMEESFLLSAIILLFIFPYYAFDLGAIYSFIALSGILILAKPLSDSLSYLLFKGLSLLLATSISALVFSIPISLSTFGYYQVFSIFTSILIGPLVLVYMILSILYLFIPSLETMAYIVYRLIELILSIDIIPVQKGWGCYFGLLFGTIALLLSKIFRNMHYLRKEKHL